MNPSTDERQGSLNSGSLNRRFKVLEFMGAWGMCLVLSAGCDIVEVE
jgi:hypothetical protein